MTGWLLGLGGAAGAAQAGLLWRAARRRPGPAALLARLGLVAGVLLLAARAGQLLPGAAGWLAGFLLAGALLAGRAR